MNITSIELPMTQTIVKLSSTETFLLGVGSGILLFLFIWFVYFLSTRPIE